MELEQLIPQYGEHDSQLKQIKAVCEEEKNLIKGAMTASQLDTATYGGYKVTKTETIRESLNTVKALNILKEYWGKKGTNETCPYIKMVETLDMDSLESDIYANKLDKDTLLALDTCREKTPVVTLKCVKTKEKK